MTGDRDNKQSVVEIINNSVKDIVVNSSRADIVINVLDDDNSSDNDNVPDNDNQSSNDDKTSSDDKRPRQAISMGSRESVVETMYYADDRKEVAIWQLINKLGNLSTVDFNLTVKILTDAEVAPADRLEGMKLLWDKQQEWQEWLGRYPSYDQAAKDPKFRTFVDAVVRANNRVAQAFTNGFR